MIKSIIKEICLLLLFLLTQETCFAVSPTEVLNQIERGDQNGLWSTFSHFETSIQENEISFCESLKFLEGLTTEINARYMLSLTLKDACQIIRQNLPSIQIPSELRNSILSTVEMIENGLPQSPVNQTPSVSLEAHINLLGYGVYWPWEWNWFGLNKQEPKSKQLPPPPSPIPPFYHQRADLELPPKMAAGFMCALGGALLCVIPGGQGIGLTLIGTGIGLALDGMVNGERPYYIDPHTNQRITPPTNSFPPSQ